MKLLQLVVTCLAISITSINGAHEDVAYVADRLEKSTNGGPPRRRLNEDIPDSIDWRTKGAVSKVKDIENCGSGWAAATADAIESNVVIDGLKPLTELSFQQLVDCSNNKDEAGIYNDGCHGGLVELAFPYVVKNGLAAMKTYPYVGRQGACKADGEKVKPWATVEGFEQTKDHSVEDLKSAVAEHGPVIVAIDSSSATFMHYGDKFDSSTSKKVLSGYDCGGDHSRLDHYVVVVGYTSSKDLLYPNCWIIKNNWGQSWGDLGFGYLKIEDRSSHSGTCGILKEPGFYPVGGSESF